MTDVIPAAALCFGMAPNGEFLKIRKNRHQRHQGRLAHDTPPRNGACARCGSPRWSAASGPASDPPPPPAAAPPRPPPSPPTTTADASFGASADAVSHSDAPWDARASGARQPAPLVPRGRWARAKQSAACSAVAKPPRYTSLCMAPWVDIHGRVGVGACDAASTWSHGARATGKGVE